RLESSHPGGAGEQHPCVGRGIHILAGLVIESSQVVDVSILVERFDEMRRLLRDCDSRPPLWNRWFFRLLTCACRRFVAGTRRLRKNGHKLEKRSPGERGGKIDRKQTAQRESHRDALYDAGQPKLQHASRCPHLALGPPRQFYLEASVKALVWR